MTSPEHSLSPRRTPSALCRNDFPLTLRFVKRNVGHPGERRVAVRAGDWEVGVEHGTTPPLVTHASRARLLRTDRAKAHQSSSLLNLRYLLVDEAELGAKPRGVHCLLGNDTDTVRLLLPKLVQREGG